MKNKNLGDQLRPARPTSTKVYAMDGTRYLVWDDGSRRRIDSKPRGKSAVRRAKKARHLKRGMAA